VSAHPVTPSDGLPAPQDETPEEVPRNPGHDRKARYRQRQKLQAALVRVAEALFLRIEQGIAPDRASAELAARVGGWLLAFAEEAGVDPDGLPADCPRIEALIQRRRRASLVRQVRAYERHRNKTTKREWGELVNLAEAFRSLRPDGTFEEWADQLAEKRTRRPWWRAAWDEPPLDKS
jgi:hypothetical protein